MIETNFNNFARSALKAQSSRGRWQKEVTRMTSNDRQLVDQRWRNNQSKLEFVTSTLQAYFHSKKLTVTLLKPLAKKVISQTKGIYLDRLAKRNRHALLCWFCEKWNFVLPCIQKSIHWGEREQYSAPVETLRAEDLCDIGYLLNHH